jgi:hypothetical protein
LAQICKYLNELDINNSSGPIPISDFEYMNELYTKNYLQNIPGLISLINAQRNLKYVSLSGLYEICEELNKALAKKGCTIDSLYLLDSDCQYLSLTSLINLKRLVVENFNEEFQQCLAISKFPDLQFLRLSGDLSSFKELALLIEKTNGSISCVSIYTSDRSAENTGMLIEAIANNCPIIEDLTTHLGPKDLIYLKLLLLNCNNLNSLRLDSLNENDDIGDELLEILTKFSPESLTQIKISGEWKYSIDSFKRFFESYRERTLSHFIIIGYEENENITREHIYLTEEYYNEGIIYHSNLLYEEY